MKQTEQDDLSMDYTIEGGLVKLTQVDNKVKCSTCGYVMALVNGSKILAKSFVSVYDHKTGDIILRCGKCKTVNQGNVHTPDKECKLVV